MKKELIQKLINEKTPFCIMAYDVHLLTDVDNCVREYELMYVSNKVVVKVKVPLKSFNSHLKNGTLVEVMSCDSGRVWEFNEFKKNLSDELKKSLLKEAKFERS